MNYTGIALTAFLFSILFDLYIIKSRLLTRAVFWTSYAIIGLRIASAPAEDLFFGFALVLSVMNLWIYWGKKGIQKK